MARRYFEFTNFRNLGLEGNKNNKIILNNTLEKGKMGNLIILIGANNSGKSNVLDGIACFSKGKTSKRDETTLSFKGEDRNPEVALYLQENTYMCKKVTKNGFVFDRNDVTEEKKLYTQEEKINIIKNIIIHYNNYGVSSSWLNPYIDNILSGIINDDNFDDKMYEIKNRVNSFPLGNSSLKKLRDSIMNISYYKGNNNDISFEEECMKKYGIPFTPNIIEYEEVMIGRDDLSIDVNALEDSLFFKSVFKSIGIEPEEIINGYSQYNEYKNSASLNKIRRSIDKKIKKLNDQFNKLYFAESDKYKFTIDLDSNSINFGMARGVDEDPIMIELQSTGFRWFFNLYFNFIASTELKRGDIIIMDEPATNLHPEGQKELRRFIKDFAIKNDLTFIIATHSPFLIDVDNYDELRIVTMDNNRSSIDNLFTAASNEDPETIIPVKEALTIKQNVLYDLDTKVIWVEGLTDYCYLTAFKNMLGIENISFIPFNGVGKNDDEQKCILEKLVKAKFYSREILVDGDKAGKSFVKKCEGTVFDKRAHLLSKASEKFVEIEDLFSDNDKKKFGIEKNGEIQKKASIATLIKTFAVLSDFEDETIGNFKEVFKLFE